MTKKEERLINELKRIGQLKMDFNFDQTELYIVDAFENIIFTKYIQEPTKEDKCNE